MKRIKMYLRSWMGHISVIYMYMRIYKVNSGNETKKHTYQKIWIILTSSLVHIMMEGWSNE